MVRVFLRPWNKDQVVEPAGNQSRGKFVDLESAAFVVDDRQGRISVLVFGCPDIASGWIDLQSVKMSRNADVLQDFAGRDIVLDQAAGATFAFCINAVTISHPEAFSVRR